MKPDFSPAMLRAFLRARAGLRLADSGAPWRRRETMKAFKAETRKRSGVTNAEFHFAWMGRLLSPGPRAKLWAALGRFPADHGVTLTHGGQEP